MSGTLPAEVVVVGNAGVDTCVYPWGDEIDWSVEANFTENLDTVGQAGGYASRGYARLGRRVAFIGHVGADHHGDLVRATLARDGVDTRALLVDPRGTARSVNFMYRDGRRKNFYDGKGHMGLAADLALCRAVMGGARLAHVNLPNWARLLLPVARELGLTVACDLQDVVDPADPYRRDFVEAADVVFCSAANHEPEFLAGELWTRRPGLIVVVGMGARGCALGTAGQVRRFPPRSRRSARRRHERGRRRSRGRLPDEPFAGGPPARGVDPAGPARGPPHVHPPRHERRADHRRPARRSVRRLVEGLTSSHEAAEPPRLATVRKTLEAIPSGRGASR